MHGDCLELMKQIPDGSIDAIITDPPYQITACKWDKIIPFDLMWEQLNRIIKPNGAIVLFGSEPFSSALRMSNIKNYKYDWIWEKSRPVGHLVAKYRPMQNNELISIFSKQNKSINYYPIKTNRDKVRIDNRKKGNASGKCQHMNFTGSEKKTTRYDTMHPRTVLKIDSEHNVGKNKHPTQKPILLMEYLIKTYTNEGETVLDFTMGSGTTGVACVNTKRKFIGIEMDDNYFKIATERINETKDL
jgi:DNA modification methylase